MIIGVVHKDRELTISRLWSFNCIPDRKNRNDPEMNDFFFFASKSFAIIVFYIIIFGMRGACYKKRLRHKLIFILIIIGMSYNESKKNAHI